MPWLRFHSSIGRASLAMGLAVALSMPILATEAGATSLIPELVPDLGSTSCSFDGPASAPTTWLATSKSSAILGGQPSALDAIRMAQESEAAAYAAPEALAAGAMTGEVDLSPAVGGPRPDSLACRLSTIRPPTADADPENFLASKRLRIAHTSFDREWQRVSDDRISSRRYQRLLGEGSGDSMATLSSVNSWVNQSIAYTEDSALFGRRDFWAGAERTLALRRGDCEDIALTKMHLLAAAGIRREDMMLTIARDLVRNADHAVLIVRHDGRYYMLDNATDQVLDAASSHDYRPVLSFGDSQTWLHGY